MKRILPLPLLLVLAACAAAPRGTAPVLQEEEDDSPGVLHTVLLYLPNRIFDLFDVVRARVRVGPGAAFDIRATEYADVFVGAYTTIFAGIPGPRDEAEINWPFGFEALAGAEVSVADVSSGVGLGPGYGEFEFGLGMQLLIIGFDVGVEPWEAVDFVCGIFTLDPSTDDL